MQNLKVGDIIANQFGVEFEVRRVGKSDQNGVLRRFYGLRSVVSSTLCSVSFSAATPGEKVSDWRQWTVVDRS